MGLISSRLRSGLLAGISALVLFLPLALPGLRAQVFTTAPEHEEDTTIDENGENVTIRRLLNGTLDNLSDYLRRHRQVPGNNGTLQMRSRRAVLENAQSHGAFVPDRTRTEFGNMKRAAQAGEIPGVTYKEMIDGGWSVWSNWGDCEAPYGPNCGTGSQTRARSCNNPAPANGGCGCDGNGQWRACVPLDGGHDSETRSCEAWFDCTYVWREGGFGECSATCDTGTQIQTVWCERTETGEEVADHWCHTYAGTRPDDTQTCNPQPCPCALGDQIIAHGDQLTLYVDTQPECGESCQSRTRECHNGTLSGDRAFDQTTCSEPSDCDCVWNGQSILHGGQVTAFLVSNPICGQSCQSETRTCQAGRLSGSYGATTCTEPTDCDAGPPGTPGDGDNGGEADSGGESCTCGNGTVECLEACDDGNDSNHDSCTNTCQIATCGDGYLHTGETCDNGNTVSGDGCSAQCQTEISPPALTPVCGTLHNTCDQGNVDTVPTDTSTHYLWTCRGTDSNAECSLCKRRHGQCDSSTQNGCTVGTAVNISRDTTKFYWDCQGECGGEEASCSLDKPTPPPTPINGICGANIDTCTTGPYADAPDSPTDYQWQCLGTGGGSTASCSACIPRDGVWSDFDVGSGCSTTCGTGTETRRRTCIYPNPACPGQPCMGPDTETRSCEAGYSYHWQAGVWGSCTVTNNCGTSGTRTRPVTCQRCDGTTVADHFCGGSKPATTRGCTGTPTCSGCASTPYWSGSFCGECTDDSHCTGGKICDTERWACRYPAQRCGNGILEGTEICDDGTLNGHVGHCDTNCSCGTMQDCRADYGSWSDWTPGAWGPWATTDTGVWGSWSSCSNLAGGTQTRSRTLTQNRSRLNTRTRTFRVTVPAQCGGRCEGSVMDGYVETDYQTETATRTQSESESRCCYDAGAVCENHSVCPGQVNCGRVGVEVCDQTITCTYDRACGEACIGDWSAWTRCSATCTTERGWQSRRWSTTRFPTCGGSACPNPLQMSSCSGTQNCSSDGTPPCNMASSAECGVAPYQDCQWDRYQCVDVGS